jgi:hypothetical protein
MVVVLVTCTEMNRELNPHPREFRVLSSLLPNINGTRRYETPLLCVQTTSDHRQDIEINRVEYDTSIRGGPYADSSDSSALHGKKVWTR